MCSQPPRDIDDSDRIREHLRLVELMDRDVEYLGITGGEPTLLKDDLFALIAKCKQCLPKARLHVLTNGRMFYYESFARKAADVGHPHLTWAIPLYSDIDREHDYIVQGQDAFLQSTTGIYNLARCGQQIEIRIVLHALSYKRLPRLAEFIYKNFPFVSHIALMGLEIVGYAKANLDLLWVDPFDYRDELKEAVSILANRGMHVSIYNHQLCILDESLWEFARKSISDWKNVFLEECGGCDLRNECGGFFASAMIKHSAHIRSMSSPQSRDGFPSRVLSKD
jgi:His-Xaa-Ser system radical SAM maturase HxsC